MPDPAAEPGKYKVVEWQMEPGDAVAFLVPSARATRQWDRDVDPRLSTANLAFTRVCLVPYEMLNLVTNVSRPGTKDTAVDMALHHEAWLVFGTAATVAAAKEKGRRQGSQFRVVGHPKVEALRAAEPEWPLPGRLPRVFWSTHHSLGNGWTGFGQLDVTRQSEEVPH